MTLKAVTLVKKRVDIPGNVFYVHVWGYSDESRDPQCGRFPYLIKIQWSAKGEGGIIQYLRRHQFFCRIECMQIEDIVKFHVQNIGSFLLFLKTKTTYILLGEPIPDFTSWPHLLTLFHFRSSNSRIEYLNFIFTLLVFN